MWTRPCYLNLDVINRHSTSNYMKIFIIIYKYLCDIATVELLNIKSVKTHKN